MKAGYNQTEISGTLERDNSIISQQLRRISVRMYIGPGRFARGRWHGATCSKANQLPAFCGIHGDSFNFSYSDAG
jgi:hypothetical protein